MFSEKSNAIFEQVITDYHRFDCVDQPHANPYTSGTIEYLLYMKNWIDTVQWHLEDIIRDPQIDPVEALKLKRRIDSSNQERTDMVEYIDSYFFEQFRGLTPQSGARVNTETPAWAVDRLSILALKIYHMTQEASRTDVGEDHRRACQKKADTLLQQRIDLSTSIDQLIEDLQRGQKYMKVYKQMKMYNDPTLNPVLYAAK